MSISASLKTESSPGILGTITAKRLQITDMDGQTTSIATRSLVQTENVPTLSFFTKIFWTCEKVVNTDGSQEFILINRSSFKKRMQKLGYSKAEIQTVLSSGKLIEQLKKLAHQKLNKKVFEQDVILRESSTLPGYAYVADTINQANRNLIENIHDFFPSDNRAVEKRFGDLGNPCKLISTYDASSSTRKVVLEYQRGGSLKSVELISKKIMSEADEKAARIRHFNGLDILKAQRLLARGNFAGLTDADLNQIIDALISHKDLKYMTDYLVAEGSRIGVTGLDAQRVSYPILITGLSREITIISPQKILIHAAFDKGDQIINAGSFKTIEKTVCLVSGQTFATAKKVPGAFGADELKFRKTLSKKPGIAAIECETETRVVEPLYQSDLRDCIHKLTFEARLKLLPSIFSGLKALHAQGIIHRDIKPDNILIKQNFDGTYGADISDLGLAVKKGSSEAKIWGGTEDFMDPHYKSAKQAFNFAMYLRGEADQEGKAVCALTDEKLDIYALGLTLQHLFPEIDIHGRSQASYVDPNKKVLWSLINKMSLYYPSSRANWHDINSLMKKISF